MLLVVLLLLLRESLYVATTHQDRVDYAPRIEPRVGIKPKRGYGSHGYVKIPHGFKTELSLDPERIMLRCKVQEPLEHIVWVVSRCPGHGGNHHPDRLVAEATTVNDPANYDVRILGANSSITSELLIKNPLSAMGAGVYRCEAWPHGGGGPPYGQYVAQDVYIIGGKELLKTCFGGWEAPQPTDYTPNFAKTVKTHGSSYPAASSAVEKVAPAPQPYEYQRPVYRRPSPSRLDSSHRQQLPEASETVERSSEPEPGRGATVQRVRPAYVRPGSNEESTERPLALVYATQGQDHRGQGHQAHEGQQHDQEHTKQQRHDQTQQQRQQLQQQRQEQLMQQQQRQEQQRQEQQRQEQQRQEQQRQEQQREEQLKQQQEMQQRQEQIQKEQAEQIERQKQEELQTLLRRYQAFMRQKQMEASTVVPPRSYSSQVTSHDALGFVPSRGSVTPDISTPSSVPPAWSQLVARVQSRSSRALYGAGNNGTIERLDHDSAQ